MLIVDHTELEMVALRGAVWLGADWLIHALLYLHKLGLLDLVAV